MKTTIFNKTSLTLLVLTFISLIFLSSCKENSDTKNTQMNNNSKTNSMQDTMKTTGDNGSSMLDKNSKDMMKKMHAVKLSENIDIDFMTMMAMHHQGGIDMANIVIANGSDEKIKSFAKTMIDDQGKEIKEIQSWLSKNKDVKSSASGNSSKLMDAMMSAMKEMKMSGNVDKDFLSMMMMHHEEAIAMAEIEIKYGANAEAKKMAQEVITKQQNEIKEMRTLQK